MLSTNGCRVGEMHTKIDPSEKRLWMHKNPAVGAAAAELRAAAAAARLGAWRREGDTMKGYTGPEEN